jgi:biotin carboxylase
VEKDKILILGSDYGTIDIVNEAHKMGLYVIVSDLMETSPTKQNADESWLISTTDIDLLEKKCIENGVKAVITGASDFNIERSRELCKRLKLPVYCESDRAWEVATNKREFKELCKKVGAPIAKDYYLSDDLSQEELEKIQYPVVVKPVDKSGNRGMSYCSNQEELIKAYKYARGVSENSTIIVERELHGPEFAVNYILANGEINLLFFSSEHNQPGELDNLYSLIVTTSSHLKQYIEEVNDKVIEVLKQAECRDGVAWVECILDDDGKFYLLEMGYRFGGEVVNVPYEKVCGFNSIRWMIEYALGIKHTKEDLPPKLTNAVKACAATYLLFATHDGVINKIEGLEEVAKLPNVTIDVPKRLGGSVRFHATMGDIHIAAENIDELCDTLKAVNSILKITDTEGKDMFIYFDDYESLKKEYNAGIKEFQI